MTTQEQGAGTRVGRDERQLLRHALRFPRGRYHAGRAAQLSGIPKSTVYDWVREKVLVPDFHRATPRRWSNRDLVYLRLLARLRQHGMPRDAAAERVRLVRKVAALQGVDEVRLTRRSLLLADHTFISPAVLGGEPCIEGTRIPTASVYWLVRGRGMSATQVVALYPQLAEARIEEAVELERRMRERQPAA